VVRMMPMKLGVEIFYRGGWSDVSVHAGCCVDGWDLISSLVCLGGGGSLVIRVLHADRS